MDTLKEQLRQACLSKVAENISSAEQLLQNIIESKLSDTKSSAGDKFETSRERLQAEEDRINSVLIKAKTLEHKLKSLNQQSCSKAEEGALVVTEKAYYFISVGLGKIKVNDKDYYTISSDAPISKLMWNKQVGDNFSINNSTQTIIEIH